MKKILPSAVLLLLLLLVSGSTVYLFAGQAAAPPAGPVRHMQGTVVPMPVPTYANDWTDPQGATDPGPGMIIQPANGPLEPRKICPRDFYLNIVDVSVHNKMIVKFTEESKIRWRNGAPYSKVGASVGQILSFLGRHPEVKMRRLIQNTTENVLDFYETNGERNTGKDLANMNNYYMFEISNNPDPMSLYKEVISLDLVETAYYEPKSEPACADIAPTTPNYEPNQAYLGPANSATPGVDAIYAGTYDIAGRGRVGAYTVDVEWDWTEDHEDWNSFSVIGGDAGGVADHGDACSSIVAACSNGYGVTGESFSVTERGVSVEVQGSYAAGFILANNYLSTGMSYFIEIHSLGPTPIPDPGCTCNCGQYKYIAVEYWSANFDAILTSTSNGRIVYEAAGNGSMNLDNSVYANHFNRSSYNSGAILVGAGIPATVGAECWTNYGSRVDVSGWGDGVYASGYGDLFNPTGNRNQMYTATFSGTSSATPICVGAGNCLQGISQNKYGITLSPAQMQSYLTATGTPWTGTKQIGPRPNLLTAINYIEPDVAPYGHSGWYSAFVPRNANDATSSTCALTALDGNTNDTYLNFWGKNVGRSPAPDGVTSNGVGAHFYLDGSDVAWASWGRIGAGGEFYGANLGTLTVAGGRHSLQYYLDPSNDFAEADETNNSLTEQFVWSPLQLTNNTPVERGAPPLKSWGSPAYYNGDGFRATGTWWLGAAVMPQSGNDVDLYAYADGYTATSGFDATQVTSTMGGGTTDFVLINGNSVGNAPSRLFQTIRYSDASTSNVLVEADGSHSDSWYLPYSNTRTMGANELIEIYELSLIAGNQYYIGVSNVSANLDLDLRVYAPGSSYFSLGGSTWNSVSHGAGGSEYVIFTPTVTGYYAAVVIKPTYAGYGVSGNYTFKCETPGTANLLPAVSSGWDAPSVPRNMNDATTTSVHIPATLTGNATAYLNLAIENIGTAVTSGSFVNRGSLDNVPLLNLYGGAGMNPFTWVMTNNFNIGLVRGGRHTITIFADTANAIVESNETDNTWSGQYVWSPYVLTRGVPVLRSAPPLNGGGAYPNSDGFSFTPTNGYASAVGLLGATAVSDYDMSLYSDYSGATAGFSTFIGGSAYGTAQADYIVYPWRLASSSIPIYPAVTNFNGAGDGVYVQAENSYGREFSSGIVTLTNPDTLAAGSVLNVYEIAMQPGRQYHVHCQIVSGTAPLEMRLFRDSTTVVGRPNAVAISASSGSGGDLDLFYSPTISTVDWYALVVAKTSPATAGTSVIYDLDGGINHGPMPVTNMVIQQWMTDTQVKLTWNHVNLDSAGVPIYNRYYVIYRNGSTGIVPLPADSIGWTTDSTYIDPSVSIGKNFYRVKVRGN